MGYKMIQNGSVVEADLTPCYVRYHPRRKTFVRSSAEDATFVMSRDGEHVWRLSDKPIDGFEEYGVVNLVEAEDDEVSALVAALDANKEPIVLNLPVSQPPPEEEMSDDAIKLLKEHLMARLAHECDESLAKGFTIKLSDKKKHRFSLTVADQLNLFALDSMRLHYRDCIPYQAIGEDVKTYSEADFDLIVKGAAELRASHYIYLKNLCAYVNTLETYKELQGVSYGMKIPSEHQIIKMGVQK